mgnify:CR=1 FL=1
MAQLGGSGVSIESLLKAAAIAALVIAGGQFLLDVVADLAEHGEILFDEGDRFLTLLIGVVGTATLVATVFWIVDQGTDEWIVVQAMAAVYVATLVEAVLRSVVFDWAEIEVWTLLTSLSMVLYFLTFVIAYRIAFEDRSATDWQLDAVTSKL